MLRNQGSSSPLLFALATVLAACASAADFPGEITDPCAVFSYCNRAQPGTPGNISVFSGFGSLTNANTSPAGSILDPWILQAGAPGTPLYLSFTGTGSGGPLRGPVDLNPTGSNHATGRFFLLSLRNTSSNPWTAVRLDLELTPGVPSSTHDALSFGEGFNTIEDPDLLNLFSSSRFSRVTRIPSTFVPDAYDIPGIGLISDFITDAIVFSGGTVLPNQTADLLFAINNGVGVGVVPAFYLRAEANSPIPEPSTLGLAGLALAALVFRRRQRRRR